jgi:hypothetical protein
MQANIRNAVIHNLDSMNYNVQTTCYGAAKKAFQQSSIKLTGSSIRVHAQYKPGGTMALAQGNIVGRLIRTYSDPLGRWTTLTLAGRDNTVIKFVTAYQSALGPQTLAQPPITSKKPTPTTRQRS